VIIVGGGSMTLRRLLLVTHRWFGLGASLILAVTGVTGALLASPIGDTPVRAIAHALHEHLAMGALGGSARKLGYWTVVWTTVVSILLLLGGVFLWWERKIILVRTGKGWRRTFFDLLHSVGILGLALMFLMAVTGAALPFWGGASATLLDLHTGRGYSQPIKLIYMAAATAFMVQGMTGIVMWWKPKRPFKNAGTDE